MFDFVTDVSITADNIDDYLARCMTVAANRTLEDFTNQEKIDEEVRLDDAEAREFELRLEVGKVLDKVKNAEARNNSLGGKRELCLKTGSKDWNLGSLNVRLDIGGLWKEKCFRGSFFIEGVPILYL